MKMMELCVTSAGTNTHCLMIEEVVLTVLRLKDAIIAEVWREELSV